MDDWKNKIGIVFGNIAIEKKILGKQSSIMADKMLKICVLKKILSIFIVGSRKFLSITKI